MCLDIYILNYTLLEPAQGTGNVYAVAIRFGANNQYTRLMINGTEEQPGGSGFPGAFLEDAAIEVCQPGDLHSL